MGLIPVSKSFTSDYQPLNPQQLYPSHTHMAGSRAKQALNAGKSSVYKQEMDSRYGVSLFTFLLILFFYLFIIFDYD